MYVSLNGSTVHSSVPSYDTKMDKAFKMPMTVTDVNILNTYWNQSNTFDNALNSVSGYYNLNFMYRMDIFDNIHGFVGTDAMLSVSLDKSFSSSIEIAECVFGTPTISGLPMSGLAPFAYCTRPPSVEEQTLSSYNSDVSTTLFSGLNFNGFRTAARCNYTFTVSVPFTIYFVVPAGKQPAITRDSVRNIFLGNCTVTKTANYAYDDKTNGATLGTIQDRLDNQIQKDSERNKKLDEQKKELQEQNKKLDEQNKKLDEQNKEQKGFFAKVIEWFANFPKMLLSIVVPSEDVFSDFMNEMKDFFNSKMGFLGYPVELFTKLLSVIYPQFDNGKKIFLMFPGFSIMGYRVWSTQSVDLLGILEPFSSLMDAVRLGLSVVFVGGFILLCQKKFDEVLGGGSD